ncbi:MAG: response regulator [Elusimicrobia bacterium]|nr:response regulator [Elusimicrobiota bacterium]
MTDPNAIPPAGGPRILAVDDATAMLRLLWRVLEQRGFAVDTAGDHSTALAMAGRGDYQLILLDMHMPGVSLRETVDGFKAALPDTPVLLMTGDADASLIEEARALGAYGPIMKPIDMAELEETIRRLMRRR